MDQILHRKWYYLEEIMSVCMYVLCTDFAMIDNVTYTLNFPFIRKP